MSTAAHHSDSADRADTRQDMAELAAIWREQITRHWKLLLAIGIVMQLAGLFSIFAPIITSISVAIFTGWALLIGGAIQFAHVLRREAGWERAWHLLVALITVLAGLAILLFPLTGTISLTVVLVVWFFLSGGAQLTSWWQNRRLPGSWTDLISGVASLLLGILIWADLPSSAAWAIGLLVGVELILYGMSLTIAAITGRSLTHTTR